MEAAKPVRIPYDSLVLAAIVAELQPYVGGRVQGIRQPGPLDVSIGLYANGAEAMLWLSCDPVFARAHLATRRPPNPPQPPAFCQALRARIDGGRIVAIRQIGFDRILAIEVVSSKGDHVLVAELMGKHANLILLDEHERIVGAAKTVGRAKSSRPVVSGLPYEPPPFPVRPSLLTASEDDDLKQFEGLSPFLSRWLAARGPGGLAEVQAAVSSAEFEVWASPDQGAYPMPLAPLGIAASRRPSLSAALEAHFDEAVRARETESIRQSVSGPLRRILAAREAALADLRHAAEVGAGAGKWQRMAELIQAYGPSAAPGQASIQAWDYDGNEITIPLDPELDYLANAQRLFDKAKRAKARLGQVGDQLSRLEADRADLIDMLARLEQADRLTELRELKDEALKRRWLSAAPAGGSQAKEDRPYEGHRIREMLGPQGVTVLFGENAEANDYLTLRVAKPNDWWLHVRGQISAHVVVPTGNHPERISREVLAYAAGLAVQNSPAKHSGYVPVDYTLKKYVRKPKGAPKGTALYTHEKTLHVDG